jgi:hypothetical protein
LGVTSAIAWHFFSKFAVLCEARCLTSSNRWQLGRRYSLLAGCLPGRRNVNQPNSMEIKRMKFTHLLAAAALAASSASCFADQPNMQAALAALQQARDSLQNATADKGGHRARAIKTVNQAIAEVKAGIEYDRTHESKNENQKR